MRTALLILCSATGIFAQPTPVLETLAGGNTLSFPANTVSAISATLVSPFGLASDPAGNLYVSDTYLSQVFKITIDGKIAVFAGNGTSGYSGDGGPAAQAELTNPVALALDANGNLYIGDSYWAVIRMVDLRGIIHTFAGNPGAVQPGDGGPALQARFLSPDGLAVNSAGDVYIADSDPRSDTIREVDTSGIVTKIAGEYGFYGDPGNGLSTVSSLFAPGGLAVDSRGNLYFADTEACGIWQISPSFNMTQFAGDGNCAFDGDGAATGHALDNPAYLTFGSGGNLYVTDVGTQRIRVIGQNQMSTVAGTGAPGYNGDGIPAAKAQLEFPEGIGADSTGNVYFAESYGHRVREIDTQGVIHTVAGVGANLPLGDGGAATSAVLLQAQGIVSDRKGGFYVLDSKTSTVRSISPNGAITTVAGTGLAGYNGDGIPATQAQLYSPFALALDAQGNLYISDSGNNRVRMINAQGIIQTVAGTGAFGFNGDGIPANQAELARPEGITIDPYGDLLICDIDNHRLRIVAGGMIGTIAGNKGQTDQVPPTDSGDGMSALTASFVFLYGVAVDPAGNVYTADEGTNRIRKIGTDGIIRPFAGESGNVGTTGDGGPATNATLNYPYQIATDGNGNVFISCDDRIREVTTDGIIHTLIGGGSEPQKGSGQIATAVALQFVPYQIWPSPDGSLYIADVASVLHYVPGQISREGVQNVANFAGGGTVAPGEIIVMYGSSLGPAALTTPTFTSSPTAFPTSIAGTQVLFDGTAAPLLYVQSGLIALVVPFEVAGKTVTHVQASINGTPTNQVDLGVVPVNPGMWPSAVNADGSINSASNPARAGQVVSFYLSGAGVTNPALSDGQFVEDSTHLLAATVQVTIGGQSVQPVYAGAAPDSIAGQVQITVPIPSGTTPSIAVPVTVTVGGVAAATNYTIAVN
jgi:uncharacterized protein (TIGR03437 family)